MTSGEFRTALDTLGLTQATLARRLIELGDQRPYADIQRVVRRWVHHGPGCTVPPWAVVLINLLLAEQVLKYERDVATVEAMAERAMAR